MKHNDILKTSGESSEGSENYPSVCGVVFDSFEDIASEFDMPLGTVMSYWKRGTINTIIFWKRGTNNKGRMSKKKDKHYYNNEYFETFKEIGQQYNCSKQAPMRYYQKHGTLEGWVPPLNKPRKFRDEYFNTFLEIAEKYGCSVCSPSGYYRKHGTLEGWIPPHEQETEYVYVFRNVKGIDEIVSKFNTSKTTLRNYYQKHGTLEGWIPPDEKYEFRGQFFRSLNQVGEKYGCSPPKYYYQKHGTLEGWIPPCEK